VAALIRRKSRRVVAIGILMAGSLEC